MNKNINYPNDTIGIKLTSQQFDIVINDFFSQYSEHGLSRNYSIEALNKMKIIIDKSIDIKNKELSHESK